MDRAALAVKSPVRDFEYWTPQPLWRGETAFVLASGPSLTTAVAEKVRDRHAIAVNSSCAIAPFAEVLFFTDSSWYEPRRKIVQDWPDLVISMSRTAKRELPDKIRRVLSQGDPDIPPARFPALGSQTIQQGRSSGHTAVALAIALGAARIILLGFDMRLVNGVEHCHDEYKGPRDVKVYERNFVPGFRGWNAAAIASGVEILNATPDSAITEFPFADLDEVLTCGPS